MHPLADRTAYRSSARNQLSAITSPSVQASFKYDALGRRTEKTVNGDTVHYLYDGAQVIAELRNGAVSAAYHPGIELDEVLARYTAQGQKTLLQDALNSVIAQTDATQNATNWQAYSPYGETQSLGPDEGNPLQYTGRENDKTGLYYYRARYYDPALKRFISEDPIGLAGGLMFTPMLAGIRFRELIQRDWIGTFHISSNLALIPIRLHLPSLNNARARASSVWMTASWDH